MHCVIREAFLPESFAVAGQSRRPGRAVIQEVDEQPRAVTGNRRRGLRALPVSLLRQASLVDLGCPDQVAGVSVVTHNRLNSGVLISRREQHLIADDRR